MNLALVPAVQSIVFDSSLIKNLRLHYIIQEKLSPSVPGRFCGSIRLKSCDVRVHWSLKHCRARDSIHQRFLCEVSALHFNRLTSSSQTLHTHTHTLSPWEQTWASAFLTHSCGLFHTLQSGPSSTQYVILTKRKWHGRESNKHFIKSLIEHILCSNAISPADSLNNIWFPYTVFILGIQTALQAARHFQWSFKFF